MSNSTSLKQSGHKNNFSFKLQKTLSPTLEIVRTQVALVHPSPTYYRANGLSVCFCICLAYWLVSSHSAWLDLEVTDLQLVSRIPSIATLPGAVFQFLVYSEICTHLLTITSQVIVRKENLPGVYS